MSMHKGAAKRAAKRRAKRELCRRLHEAGEMVMQALLGPDPTKERRAAVSALMTNHLMLEQERALTPRRWPKPFPVVPVPGRGYTADPSLWRGGRS